MSILALFAFGSRLLLAVVFGLAGIAKLRDRAGFYRSLGDFGLPASLQGPLSAALPMLEIGVALSLCFASAAVIGASLALALLLAFIGVIAASLARGRTPNCQCFGQLHSVPVGPKVLVRNSVLAALALLVLLTGAREPGPSIVAWLVPLTAFERAVIVGGGIGLGLLSAAIATVVKLTRQNEHLLARLDAASRVDAAAATEPTGASRRDPATQSPGIGTPAPDFSIQSIDGQVVTLQSLLTLAKPVLLVFADPECGPCTALLPRIAEWQRTHRHALTIPLISRGTAAVNRTRADPHGLVNVLIQRDREVALAYGIPGTPAAVLIGADGAIGSAPVQGEVAIAKLVDQSLEGVASAVPVAAHLAVGDPLPPFTLTDLHGEIVDSTRILTMPTVLLFWNPGCGFCRRILEDVRALDARPPAERPQLLVVSSGRVEDHVEMGLTSTILLDSGFVVGSRLGARGTPSAVLIDENGRLAGGLVSGTPGVLEVLAMTISAGLPGDSVLHKQEGIEDELLPDGGMILYNTRTRQVLTLNGTAALVWEGCDGERTIGAIVGELRDLFPSAPDADRDVRQLVANLLTHRMVSLTPAPAHA